MLNKIRAVFGLNLSELARIFEVERREVYAWIRGLAPVPDGALSRLQFIHELSLQWGMIGESPTVPWIRWRLGDRGSILDMLETLSGSNPPAKEDFASAFEVLSKEMEHSRQIRMAGVSALSPAGGADSEGLGYALDNITEYLPPDPC